jgi:DNA helicase-2/ATP-dependent DNA helicase PcrA
MKERVNNLLRVAGCGLQARPFVGTFHSLAAHILRQNAKSAGLPRFFSILDKEDSLAVIKTTIKELNIDPKQFEPARIRTIISRKKGELVKAEDFSTQEEYFFPRTVGLIWQKYEEKLAKQKALDFDDLILKCVLLLRKNKEVCGYYQTLWEHIHVDEYQDTNKAQYELVKILSSKHKNICVVGDTDQSIYGWRGADFRNVLDFEEDYPNTKVAFLEENYRSTKTILAAANAVISNNKLRKEKNLFTNRKQGEKITVFSAENEENEANFVAEESGWLVSQNKAKPQEIAVLYRANFQSRALEESFIKNGVPYQVVGVRFFERKEIKDILAFIRFALNPDDMEGMKRIINIPPRGIGKVGLAKILSNKESELPQKTRKNYEEFKKLVGAIQAKSLKEKPSSLIKFIMKQSGLENQLKNISSEDKARLENLKELVSIAVKYDHLPGTEGLERLLEEAVLVSDQDALRKKDLPAGRHGKEGVRLMTVHTAKGLEFKYVFIVGLEEGLFPSSGFGEEDTLERKEEERRLFYVGLTRAEEKLYLSFSQSRIIFGSKQLNLPSRFLGEIPDNLLEEKTEKLATINIE